MAGALASPDLSVRPSSAALLGRLREVLSQVLHGKPDVILQTLVAVLARGHVLLEDVPGVGKTTLGHGLASALGCSFRRVQFTSDLLPSDILGVNVFDQGSGQFRFVPGPIFSQVVLADEVNRATPKTQSSLLEAMNEGQVSIDGVTRPLPRPFLVLATQNPAEHHGTFPLPESQLDRFLLRLSVGYPDRDAERLVLREGADSAPRPVPVALSPEALITLQEEVAGVDMADEVEDYLLALVDGTRRSPELALGVSPRGTQALGRAARARALLDGRGYVVPDDVKAMAVPVLAHRVVLAGGASTGTTAAAEKVVAQLVRSVPPPR